MNQTTPPKEAHPQAKAYQGDLQKTAVIDALCKVEPDKRDDTWRQALLENLPDASLAAGTPQVISGPDGFPYFHLQVPESGTRFQCFVMRQMTKDFLLKNGFGVALHPAKGHPDWIFTYGDIVNFHLYNEFYSPVEYFDLPKEETFDEGKAVLVGQPSETFLPEETRASLRTYFKSKQVDRPKILLMKRSTDTGVLEELVFNLSPDLFESKEQMNTVMKGALWFLPRHYRVAMMEESSTPEKFMDL